MALRGERDFYRGLLALGAAQDIEPLLDEALALIAEAVATGTASAMTGRTSATAAACSRRR